MRENASERHRWQGLPLVMAPMLVDPRRQRWLQASALALQEEISRVTPGIFSTYSPLLASAAST